MYLKKYTAYFMFMDIKWKLNTKEKVMIYKFFCEIGTVKTSDYFKMTSNLCYLLASFICTFHVWIYIRDFWFFKTLKTFLCACTSICLYVLHMCVVPLEARRGQCIPRTGVADTVSFLKWGVGTESLFSVRTIKPPF